MTTFPPITDLPAAALDRPGASGQAPDPMRGIFEPPRGFVVSAIARNKLIVLLVAVILAAAGIAVGVKRPPAYTASATLQVGQVNPNSPGFNGYTQSATALAAVFSRAIEAEPVLITIQHKLQLAPARSTKLLSAEPLALAPAFRVVATGASSSAAIQLANTAAGAIVAYVSQTNSANPQAASLLKEYHEVSVQQQKTLAKIANTEFDSRKQGKSKSELARSDALVSAEAEKDATNARLRAIGAAYSAAISSQAPRTGLLTLLAGATSASSNRRSKVELYGLIGLLAGIIVGCGAAVMRERLRLRRQLVGVVDTGTKSPSA